MTEIVVQFDCSSCREPFCTPVVFVNSSVQIYGEACSVKTGDIIGEKVYTRFQILTLVLSSFAVVCSIIVLFQRRESFKTSKSALSLILSDMALNTIVKLLVFWFCLIFISADFMLSEDVFSYAHLPLAGIALFLPISVISSHLVAWRRTLAALVGKSEDSVCFKHFHSAFLVIVGLVCFLRAAPFHTYVCYVFGLIFGCIVFTLFLFYLINGLRVACILHSNSKSLEQHAKSKNSENKKKLIGDETARLLFLIIVVSLCGVANGIANANNYLKLLSEQMRTESGIRHATVSLALVNYGTNFIASMILFRVYSLTSTKTVRITNPSTPRKSQDELKAHSFKDVPQP